MGLTNRKLMALKSMLTIRKVDIFFLPNVNPRSSWQEVKTGMNATCKLQFEVHDVTSHDRHFSRARKQQQWTLLHHPLIVHHQIQTLHVKDVANL